MNRRHFITFTASLGAGTLAAQTTAAPAPAAPEKKETGPALKWHDVESWGLEGRAWIDQERLRYYDRLPASAEGKVTPAVWDLSRHSTGMAVRFRSNATHVQVRYRLMSASMAKPHMPATGVSGTDLYARDAKGAWRWVNVSQPQRQDVLAPLATGVEPEPREWMLYLPLFNGVEKLEIGVNENAEFTGEPPREKGTMVFYGTSITHGASASRPGMTHPAILGRRLDRPVHNVGFSGNGRMDAAVGDFLVQLDAAVFVIDCLPNMAAPMVRERCVPLVRQIRAARPDTPIVLVEDRRNTNSWINPARAAHHTANHAALRESFSKLKQEGVRNLFYLEGDALLGDDSEASVDGSHPTDLGFMRQADAFEPVLRQALQTPAKA